MNIPNKAVEAAAKSNFEQINGHLWDNQPGPSKDAWRRYARRTLEAATPFIAAQAWDDGYEAGANDGDPLIQIRLAKGEDVAAKNPHTNHAQINDEPQCEWCGWCRDCTRDPERPANNGEVSTWASITKTNT